MLSNYEKLMLKGMLLIAAMLGWSIPRMVRVQKGDEWDNISKNLAQLHSDAAKVVKEDKDAE